MHRNAFDCKLTPGHLDVYEKVIFTKYQVVKLSALLKKKKKSVNWIYFSWMLQTCFPNTIYHSMSYDIVGYITDYTIHDIRQLLCATLIRTENLWIKDKDIN